MPEVEQGEQLAGVPRVLVIGGRQVEDLGGRHGEPDTATLKEGPRTPDDLSVVRDGIKPEHADLSAGGGAKTEQGLDHGGFARSVGAEERDNFTLVDVAGDTVNRRQGAELDLEVDGLNRSVHVVLT